MIILGIDPGSRRTGWGLVRKEGLGTRFLAGGTVNLNVKLPLEARLARLAETLEGLLGEHRPDCCAMESIFTAQNARSALVLGHARGVILCTVARAGIPLYEYAPTVVKQAVVGQGRATKEQVQRMVGLLLARSQPLREDEADALAVALTHAAAARLELRA